MEEFRQRRLGLGRVSTLQLADFGSRSWRVHGVDDTVATLVGERSYDELAVARRGRRWCGRGSGKGKCCCCCAFQLRLLCRDGKPRRKGRSQQGERRKGEKEENWALVAHRRQRMSSDEVVLPLLHALARRDAFAITTAR